MKYITAKLFILVTVILLVACDSPKDIKVTYKETTILFSEVNNGILRNNRKYVYMIEGIHGKHIASGDDSCLKTFDIAIGRPYNLKLDYKNNVLIPITDLCEMTARLSATPNM